MTSSVHYEIPAQTAERRRVKPVTAPTVLDTHGIDPEYAHPIVDEETDTTNPTTLHVVSGHFEGTPIKFNIYLPPKTSWRKRFFQYAYPLQPANALPADINFGAESGAYTVQCTGALGYRQDAATAKFARRFASRYYKVREDEIHGYLYGGSGGSFVTIGALENTVGIWQGGVPFVLATPQSIPYAQSIVSLGTLVLADKLNQLKDAVRPGGNGNLDFLTQTEKEVLAEVSKMGIPLRGWESLNYDSESVRRLLLFYPYIRDMDPTYADDFWTQDGHLGTEKSDLGDFLRRCRHKSMLQIDHVDTDESGSATKISLLDLPSGLDYRGTDASIVDDAGEVVTGIKGDFDSLTQSFTVNTALSTVVIPSGAKLAYDNSWFIASHAYHRYILPARSGFHGWDQYRHPDGKPIHPQRKIDMGPIMAMSTSGGGTHTGRYSGKMIIINNLLDIDAFPTNGIWYASQVEAAMGPAANDCFRSWVNDNAHHYNGPINSGEEGMFIQYDGIYYQALRDLADWVEEGIEPPRSTALTLKEGEISVPADAKIRGGIQPVVDLLINGQSAAVVVRSGDTVTFEASVEVPPDTGFIVKAEWDFTGNGEYTHVEPIPAQTSSHKVTITHTYTEPGTYYPVLRVASNREGSMAEQHALAQNLGRGRVVVE